ncbi:MAG: dephospho-CoA kinase [Sedimentisphaerales bacterium]|nr:dephospho-CoA kinase [Sedimentisphaerales bacterium]
MGKSTVAAEFTRQGCAVINADAIGHELLKEPSVRRLLIEAFGSDILDSSGMIDRRILGEKAFENRGTVERIEKILHPPILDECRKQIYKAQESIDYRAIVLDAPLLLETGIDKECDILVFVESDESIRSERNLRRGDDFYARIKKREKFQISLDTKRQMADYIIDNNSGFSALAGQVARILLDV